MRRHLIALVAALAASAGLTTPVRAFVIALDPEELAAPKSGSGGSGTFPSSSSSVASADGGPSEPGPVRIEAKAEKTDVAIGERFVVELRAIGPAGATFTFPAEVLTDTAELHATLPAAGPSARPPAVVPGVHRYEAALFELTDAKIPAVTVKYRLASGEEGQATSDAVAVRIVSRLAKDADPQKIADVREPIPLAIGPAFWMALGAFLIGLAALVAWLVLRRRRVAPTVAPPAPAIDPATEARAGLAALAASGLLARGDHRGYYIALTIVAKRYLERRLRAPVLEMTTAEMVAFLRESRPAASLVGPMRDLAGAADRIKFARGAGLTEEAERHTEAVRAMITTLEAAFAPAPPASAEKVA